MSKSIAYRSFEVAADERSVAKGLAAGDEASQLKATQMLMGAQAIGCSNTVVRRLRNQVLIWGKPSCQVAFMKKCLKMTSASWQFAATIIAADLVKTAGFDAPAVYHNLGSFAPAVSGRGRGFRGRIFTGVNPLVCKCRGC